MLTRTTRVFAVTFLCVMMLTVSMFASNSCAGFVTTLQIEQGLERSGMDEQAVAHQGKQESIPENKDQPAQAGAEPSA